MWRITFDVYSWWIFKHCICFAELPGRWRCVINRVILPKQKKRSVLKTLHTRFRVKIALLTSCVHPQVLNDVRVFEILTIVGRCNRQKLVSHTSICDVFELLPKMFCDSTPSSSNIWNSSNLRAEVEFKNQTPRQDSGKIHLTSTKNVPKTY